MLRQGLSAVMERGEAAAAAVDALVSGPADPLLAAAVRLHDELRAGVGARNTSLLQRSGLGSRCGRAVRSA